MKYLEKQALQWKNMQPEIHPGGHLRQEGSAVPFFYDGIRGTRVFAWIGMPEGASPDHKVPGIVLVHGGLGTAFSRWVNIWTKRGYAAIAMDTCGGMPAPDDTCPPQCQWPRHGWSGPSGWGAFGEQMVLPPEQQWFTHAESAIMLAHNILRTRPEVDAERIGITGVSWGGVLCLIAAGIDPRYKAVCPVYSCGFLYENQPWFNEQTKGAPSEAKEWWKQEWDPANFIPSIACPVLWLASTNDKSIFLPDAWQRSTALAGRFSERTVKLRLVHSHGRVSEEPLEVLRFFDEYLNHGAKRLRLTGTARNGRHISADMHGETPIGALLTFTADPYPNWHEKEWLSLPARITENGTVEADLPDDRWLAAYLTAITPDLREVSSDMLFPIRQQNNP